MSRAARTAWVVAMLLAVGCPPGATWDPTPPQNLSSDSPGRDEDPFILTARDGSMLVAWMSEQSGTADIRLRRTADGASFSPAVQLTRGTAFDFFPTLAQDDAGRFHAVFFRRPTRFAQGRIVYSSSADALDWTSSIEVPVTTPGTNESDWTPSIALMAGRLFVVFARDGCFPTLQPCFGLYLTSSADGASWTAPQRLFATEGAQDHLPSLARTFTGLALAWVRYDAAAALPWLSDKSDILSSRSADGTGWSGPVELTSNDAQGVTNVFPSIFPDQSGVFRVSWLAAAPGAAPAIVERQIDGQGEARIVGALGSSGYSHRVVPTPVTGRYAAAWVEGSDGVQDVYFRIFQP